MDQIWGALADPTRWRILEILKNGERTSGELAQAFALSWPTVSRHLGALEEAALVRRTARGRHRCYALDPVGLETAFARLNGIRSHPTIGDRESAKPEQTEPARAANVSNLPATVDTFIGRERELADLAGLLGRTRLLTLTGPAGVGKTRLARELAAQVAADFADGVRWVELANVSDPAHVLQAVANAVNAPDQTEHAPADALVNHLRGKHLLVVLDNCEHVRAACAALAATIVRSCARATLLATSQTALETRPEAVWQLAPLSLLDGGPSADGSESEAVRLFCARAAMIRPGFDAAPAAAQVSEICRRLDGIPLAIELAASRIGVLTPTEIAEHLNDRFALLSGGRQPALERHQTLRGALDWSHDLLPGSERRLLRRLSVFVGGMGLRAVEAVCGDDGDPILLPLASLVDGSLVIGDTSRSRARYRLLETVRAYGWEHLTAAGEVDELRARHARWFLELAEKAEPALTGADERIWLDRLETDDDNLRAALSWAIECHHHEEALRLAASLTLFWRLRNRFREGRRWLEASLAMGPAPLPALRMRVLWGAGFMALMLNDLSAASVHLDQSLDLARGLGDRRVEARSLLLLGNVWTYQDRSASNARDPIALLLDSAAAAREEGDSWCLAHALSMHGWLLNEMGELAEARRLIEESLVVARNAHDSQGLRIGLTMLGRLAQSEGDQTAAEALLTQAIEVSTELGDSHAAAAALISIGEMAEDRGEYQRAEDLLRRATQLLKDAGASAVPALHVLGRIALSQGALGDAEAYMKEAAGALDSDSTHNAGWAELGLGLLALAGGDLVAARTRFDRVSSHHGLRARADALFGLGAIARLEGDLGRSASLHHEALRLRRGLKDESGTVESLEALACVATEGGRHDHAARLFGAVEALRRTTGRVRRPAQQADHELQIACARGELGRKRFRAAFAAGEELSLERAISYATRGRGARRRPRTGWDSLTQAERGVVALAVEGLSNAQIAGRLFVSPHTVAWHLSQVYGKLDIRSRGQLAREVARQVERSRNNP